MGFLFAKPFECVPNQHKIGYLAIKEQQVITQSHVAYVKFAIEHFKEKKVDFVLLELDTPGGEVMAAQQISHLLKQLDTDKIPVVCVIDNWAISAGAMLALSCRTILASKDTSFGAAEPVHISENEMKSAPEKVRSALRAEFANTAGFFGRSKEIAQAMVDKDLILVKRKGAFCLLDTEKSIKRSDLMISPKDKLLTLDAELCKEFGIIDGYVESGSLKDFKLLQTEDFAGFKDAEVIAYKDWKIGFFSFLLNPVIASLLTTVLIFLGYLELYSGKGLFGLAAFFILALIVLSHFAVQAMPYLEIAILSLGLVFLFIEVFITPGFGVLGSLGLVLTLFALMTMQIPEFNLSMPVLSFSVAFDQLVWRFGAFLASCVLGLIIAWQVTRYFLQKAPFFKKMILQTTLEKPQSLSSALLGEVGLTLSPLRCSGKIEFKGKVFDALCTSGFIEKSKKVKIVGVRGQTLIVESM